MPLDPPHPDQPHLGSEPPSAPNTGVRHAERHTVVPYPFDVVLGVIHDVDQITTWVPSMHDGEVKQRGSDGRVEVLSCRIGDRLFSAQATFTYRYNSDGLSYTLIKSDRLRSAYGAFRVASESASTTHVWFTLAVDFGVPLPGFMKSRLNASSVDAVLESLPDELHRRTGLDP